MTDPKPELPVITVAYLVNLYPKISHSFIRREIQALESPGVEVHVCDVARRSGWATMPTPPRWPERGATGRRPETVVARRLRSAARQPGRFATLSLACGRGADRIAERAPCSLPDRGVATGRVGP